MQVDTRCLGGQKQVMDLMTNHYSALCNIKSTLNTRVPPRQHISSKMKKRGKTAGTWDIVNGKAFEEQRETFKRIANLKPTTSEFYNNGFKCMQT